MENRKLAIQNELRFINNKLTFDNLELTEWVHWFDKKAQLIHELHGIMDKLHPSTRVRFHGR
jgi:hypothetical protein